MLKPVSISDEGCYPPLLSWGLLEVPGLLDPSMAPDPLRHTPAASFPMSNHLILCHPLLLLPSVFPSIRVFSNVSALHIRWPKDWSFTLSTVLPMNTQDSRKGKHDPAATAREEIPRACPH